MVKKLIFLFAFMPLLSACSHNRLDANLQTLEGRKIDVAMHYLGLPDDKLIIDDREVFIWGYDRIETYSNPVSTYGGYGSRSGAYGGVGLVFGRPYANEIYRYSCEIKALIDAKKIIQRMEYQSISGGCSEYNDAMDAIERDFGVVAK